MLSLLLLKKIAALFVILFIGFLLVRLKLIKTSDSKPFGVVLAYVLNPITIIAALQTERSATVLKGLAFNAAVALVASVLFIAVTKLLAKPLKLSRVEEGSMAYPSVASLTIPLVTAVLGSEYVVYTVSFLIVTHVFIWACLDRMLSGESRFNYKRFFLNPNILALLLGLLLFLCNLRLPDVLNNAVQSLSDMLGPVSMLVTGMVLGGMSFKKTFCNYRVWLSAFGRLLFLPLIVLALVKFCRVDTLVNNGKTLMLILLLGAAGPPTSLVTSIALLHGEDAELASAINVASVLLCIVTIPFIAFLYQL